MPLEEDNETVQLPDEWVYDLSNREQNLVNLVLDGKEDSSQSLGDHVATDSEVSQTKEKAV